MWPSFFSTGLPRRSLGRTGLSISALGFGAGPFGDLSFDDTAAEALFRRALELGVTLVDTAPSYGASEERLGRFLAAAPRSEQDRVVVVTKGGYGVPGTPDWTPEVLTQGIDLALGRLRRDAIDVFLLHSCDARDDLVPALVRAREEGKVRAIGYSGDGAGLQWAASVPEFDVIECSVNLVDQVALLDAIPRARRDGKGILAKRAMANAAWRGGDHPYADRFRRAYPELLEFPLDELAVRFSAYADGVDAALIGTRNRGHLERAVDAVAQGPLDRWVHAAVGSRFADYATDWPGVI